MQPDCSPGLSNEDLDRSETAGLVAGESRTIIGTLRPIGTREASLLSPWRADSRA